MIILNPLEPWPGELVLEAAVKHDVSLITRVVDYGGLFHDDVATGMCSPSATIGRSARMDGCSAGREKLERLSPYAERHGLTMLQLACAWNLAQPAVRCVAPTLIQEIGPDARAIEDKRDELAAVAADWSSEPGTGATGAGRLSAAEVREIRAIGENTGCMTLKGASPEHAGEPLPDRWGLNEELSRLAERWGSRPSATSATPRHGGRLGTCKTLTARARARVSRSSDYLPWKRAARLPRKAAIPSLPSALANTVANAPFSASIPSSRSPAPETRLISPRRWEPARRACAPTRARFPAVRGRRRRG